MCFPFIQQLGGLKEQCWVWCCEGQVVRRLLPSRLISVRSAPHVQKCRRDDEIIPALLKEQQWQDSAGDSVGSAVLPGCACVLFCASLVLWGNYICVSHLLSHPGTPAAFHSMSFCSRMSCLTLFLYARHTKNRKCVVADNGLNTSSSKATSRCSNWGVQRAVSPHA